MTTHRVKGFCTLALTVVLFSSCSVGTQQAPQVERDRILTVSLLGFYNSESAEFDPAPIDYSILVDLEEVHRQIAKSVSYRFKTQPFLLYEKMWGYAFRKRPDQGRKGMRYLIVTALYLLNQFLLHQDIPPEAITSTLELPVFFAQPNESDRHVMIVGLETGIQPGILTSGLGMMVFNGHGHFLGIVFHIYDFTSYNTAKMAHDCISMLEKLLPPGIGS